VPTTIGGLLIFGALLVPGFLHYMQRRSRVPQRSLSPLVETATLTTVSLATNAVSIALFGLIRAMWPKHTPDVRLLFVEGLAYAAPRLGYLLLWGGGILIVSSALAITLAVRPRPIGTLVERFTPAIVDVSAWYHVFDEGPAEALVYVGCDLRDGSYVGGLLDWYSTEVHETADRDFVIAEPITYRPPDGSEDRTIEGFSRLVLSARDVARLYVSYVDPAATG
jgi:hypothetical protein